MKGKCQHYYQFCYKNLTNWRDNECDWCHINMINKFLNYFFCVLCIKVNTSVCKGYIKICGIPSNRIALFSIITALRYQVAHGYTIFFVSLSYQLDWASHCIKYLLCTNWNDEVIALSKKMIFRILFSPYALHSCTIKIAISSVHIFSLFF